MSLTPVQPVYGTDAYINALFNKTNEIVNYINTPQYYFKQVESGLSANNEYTVSVSGQYLVQLELSADYDNLGEQIGSVYTEAFKNGQAATNDNDTHTTTVSGTNVKVTHTHNFIIDAVAGDTIGFAIYFTRTLLNNGLITLIKTA